jgi:hypothetical protein
MSFLVETGAVVRWRPGGWHLEESAPDTEMSLAGLARPLAALFELVVVSGAITASIHCTHVRTLACLDAG